MWKYTILIDNTKNSQNLNLLAFMTVYNSFSRVFMTNKTPSSVKKNVVKVPNQKVTKWQSVLLLSSSSFSPSSSSSSLSIPLDGLVQNRMTPSRQFSHKVAVFFIDHCTSTLLLHNFEVSQGA